MRNNKKLPSDEVLLELLKKHRNVTKVLRAIGRKYLSSQHILNLGREHGLIEKSTRQITNMSMQREHDRIIPYSTLDIYEVGQTISLNGHKWVIEAVTGTRRKLYHCKNEIGLKESFDALQIKGV